MVREAIDHGMPCYGFEMEAPEYYVIHGYDDVGYYYAGPVTKPESGPVPWQKLGDTDIGVLEVYSIRPGKAADDARTVKEALSFALEHAKGPVKWVYPNYRAGLAGYDTWIDTLEAGTADGIGMSYNSIVWAECRRFGERFLREASRRLNRGPGILLQDAADQYSTVYEHLVKVVELIPFPPGNEINDKKRCDKASAHLRKARDSEEAGLKFLEKIVDAL